MINLTGFSNRFLEYIVMLKSDRYLLYITFLDLFYLKTLKKRTTLSLFKHDVVQRLYSWFFLWDSGVLLKGLDNMRILNPNSSLLMGYIIKKRIVANATNVRVEFVRLPVEYTCVQSAVLFCTSSNCGSSMFSSTTSGTSGSHWKIRSSVVWDTGTPICVP